MKKAKHHLIPIILLILFGIVNLLTLTKFPLMHSDEAWIGGLTRHMMQEGSLLVTEPFFDVFPRSLHLIKIGFHLLQMPFIFLGDFSLFALRFLSLAFSLLCLFLILAIYKTWQEPTKKTTSLQEAMIMLAFMSHTIFFLAARFARQEMVLLTLFLLVFLTLLRLANQNNPTTNNQTRYTLIITLWIGLAMTIHPNSLLLAISAGLGYLYLIWIKKINWRQICLLISLVAIYATILLLGSLYINPDFLNGYLSYGQTLGVQNSLIDKILQFPLYYQKIFQQIGATYYLPNIKILLTLLFMSTTVGLIISIYSLTKNSHWHSLPKEMANIMLTIFILGIHAGLILIGRYNTQYILFPMVFSLMQTLLIVDMIIEKINIHYQKWMFTGFMSLLIFLQFFNLFNNIKEHPQHDYPSYLNELASVLNPHTKTLGNLNAGFFFDDEALMDIRNLAFLPENMTVAQYLEKNDIQAIVWLEEMDYIYRNPDPWTILYGPMDYIPPLRTIIEKDYELTHQFESPGYGMRIIRYLDGYPWQVKVYLKRDSY